jgi:pseudouridine synthase
MSFAEATRISSRLHAIGRLDTDTTGMLLLTNDGRLVHHVTNRHASGTTDKAIAKKYQAVIMGHHTNDDAIFEQLRNEGVDIGEKYGGQTLPVDDVSVLDHPTRKSTRVSLTICEGKNRQIRRMFHALGSGVIKLKRVCIGDNLHLGELQEGQWRILSDDEVFKSLAYEPRFLVASPTRPSKQVSFSKRVPSSSRWSRKRR